VLTIKKVLFSATVFRHLTDFHLPYIHYFIEQGYEVWATANDDRNNRKMLTDLGVKCIDTSFSRNSLSIKNFKAYKEMKEIFKKEKFELVHVHTPIAAVLTRYAFKYADYGKIIYTAHGFHFFKGAPLKNWMLYYTMEKLAIDKTDYLITINKEDYDRSLKMGFDKDKVSFVHGVGVEDKTIELTEYQKMELKQKLRIESQSQIISYVAELNINKNHEFLLRNWKEIKEKNPLSTLLIIGFGKNEEKLKIYVKEKGLRDVFFLGYREDVASILQITDIICLLSFREGLPKSIMEGMMYETPAIVSDTRGLKDLVEDGVSGKVVKLNNDEELKNAFNIMLQDTDVYNNMKKAAYSRVNKYKTCNVINEYKAIYSHVMKDGEI
jgi:glycosyltransferase involved in cell wall biosynthesis